MLPGMLSVRRQLTHLAHYEGIVSRKLVYTALYGTGTVRHMPPWLNHEMVDCAFVARDS